MVGAFLLGLFIIAACASMDAATGLTVFGGVIGFVIGLYIAPDIGSAAGVGVLGAIAVIGLQAWLMKPRRRHWP